MNRVAASRKELAQEIIATFADLTEGAVDTACGRIAPNHPAASQERGMENSDQPQSRHTRTSGEGVMGGWLKVRTQLR
jgi:hypothetical protein